jgi:hypothetical protein
MRYKYYNNNPKQNHIDDCVVRAISVLTNRNWYEVYNELSDLASNKGLMFDSVEFVEDYLDKQYIRQCHYSKTVGEFAKEHPYGKYAVTMDNHITAIINGTILDTFDPSDRTMRCAWKIK